MNNLNDPLVLGLVAQLNAEMLRIGAQSLNLNIQNGMVSCSWATPTPSGKTKSRSFSEEIPPVQA
jgi:hypothetical protein